jgi:alpha-glucosidase
VFPGGHGVRVSCADGSSVQLSFLAPDVVRVRTVFGGQNDEWQHSWAVDRPAERWPAVRTEYIEQNDVCILRSDEVEVRIQRAPVLLSLVDRRTGVAFFSEASPMARDPLTGAVATFRRLGFEAHYFGLGERAARLDRRRGEFILWNSDTPGYVEGTDPLYQSIPFYIAMEEGRAHGVFYDNSFKSRFDFGRLNQEYVGYRAEGGVIDCYLFAGPRVADVLRRYGELTGRMPMPPLWALGHHQSRYSYYPDSLVEKVVDTYLEKKLPLDAVYLDIHYMNGYRSFTWDRSRFPSPAGLTRKLVERGVHLVTIVDPGIKNDGDKGVSGGYAPFESGVAGDHFLRRSNGQLYVGEVWPGPAVFADLTRAETRTWWGDLHRDFLEAGVAGFWNDMNEPSDFLDKTGTTQADVIFNGEGRKSTYAENRNLFGLLMSRATFEGLQRLQPDRRPFVITRAGFAGIQRYAVTWTGDNNASWDGLVLQISMFQSMALSGQAFVGCDIPGFIGRADGELLARAYEANCLVPLLRNHGAIDGYDHEPWRFGPQYESIVRKFIELRYQLLPYVYGCVEQAHREGLPVIRPLLLEFQDDAAVGNLDDQFMVGSALLVAPILRPAERGREVYLPAGLWYGFWSKKKVATGFQRFEAPLDHLPLFVRGGSAIPTVAPALHVPEKPWGNVRFDLYPDENDRAAGELYEDDGVSLACERGGFRRTAISLERSGNTWRVKLSAPKGDYQPPARTFEISLHAGLKAPSAVRDNGAAMPGTEKRGVQAGWHVEPDGSVNFQLPDDNGAHLIEFETAKSE